MSDPASEGAQARRFTLLGDQPHAAGDDPLDFHRLADDLARLIVSSRGSTPFTLGIEASWGMGKSTLMGRVQTALTADASVRTVQFNAWTADEQGMLEGLVKTVLDELDENALRRALKNEKLRRIARVCSSVVAKATGFGALVDGVWEAVSVDPQARNELRSLVDEAVRAWQEGTDGVPRDRLLVVFVDDLDRCSPEGVLAVFEGMKLYLDVPGLVFVVGYDQAIVSDLVLERKGYSEQIKGRDYLEKFIQTTYRIPRSSGEQVDALVAALLEESGTAVLFGRAELSLLSERNARNPRRIKRFINRFVLTYGLDQRWRAFAPETLIRVQLLYVHFESFAALIDSVGELDPVAEFDEYREARQVLRRRGLADGLSEEQVLVTAAFRRHDLRTDDLLEAPSAMLLQRLDDAVPTIYPALADQADFGSLIESLVRADDWPQLREALAEGGPPLSAVFEEEPEWDTTSLGDLHGMRILWIDDEHERNNGLTLAAMRTAGVDVTTAASTEEAEAALLSQRFDALVSDIMRGSDPEAGLAALRRFRAEGVAPELAVFCVTRRTPARVKAARELGASVTSDHRVLVELLASGGGFRSA